jgi:hypothetical protein
MLDEFAIPEEWPNWLKFLARQRGLEYAEICALPANEFRAYVREQMARFDTPDDLLMDAGFAPEYFTSIAEAERWRDETLTG